MGSFAIFNVSELIFLSNAIQHIPESFEEAFTEVKHNRRKSKKLFFIVLIYSKYTDFNKLNAIVYCINPYFEKMKLKTLYLRQSLVLAMLFSVWVGCSKNEAEAEEEIVAAEEEQSPVVWTIPV